MSVRTGLRLATVWLAFSAVCLAHHSFSAEFDSKRVVRLDGIVSSLEWTNPHALIYIRVKGPDGKSAEWMVEAAAPNAMMRRGLLKNDFKPGTAIVLEGEQARDGSRRVNGTAVTLPGGRRLPLRYEGQSEKD